MPPEDGRKAHALLTRDASIVWVKRLILFSAVIAALGPYMPLSTTAHGTIVLIVAAAGFGRSPDAPR